MYKNLPSATDSCRDDVIRANKHFTVFLYKKLPKK